MYCYSELDSFRSSTIRLLEKHFSPNELVFQYFDYPVIFPNPSAASNLMLAVET